MEGLEFWGGHECTLNRVGDEFFDQTRRTGHHDRLDDLTLFKDLGVTALRYPALWERTEGPDGSLDFAWLDERLARLHALQLRPILGLLHHGSGPKRTSLIHETFAEDFAKYAAAVAGRYPWVSAYTPINEPLTTARFSCLYGHWYPHRTDEHSTWLAVLNQIDATRQAMKAIRRINPAAKLIQTEDLGRCQSSPLLAYQADFENDRRWLTWDLLAGRVIQGHAMHDHIAGFGFAERLQRIADDPCPPDVIGVNHYPTSERFLDADISRYAPETVGGNGRHRYADAEAVRVSSAGVFGIEALLREAWERYGSPIAITERHLGCSREEQLRWLAEAKAGVDRLRAEGCEIVALTAWSLLGAYDWDSLLTRRQGRYECGVFDLRGDRPRPTAVAKAVISLTRSEALPDIASSAGWWRRDVRLTLGHLAEPDRRNAPMSSPVHGSEKPRLLITGATGTLGKAFARACDLRGLRYTLTTREDLTIHDIGSVRSALHRISPWAVINAAGWVRVDEAEDMEEACFTDNAIGPAVLAEQCAELAIPFVTFSSDLVFDGLQTNAYCEDSVTAPLGAYGRSKEAGERGVAAAGGRSLIVRTSAFFDHADEQNFAVQVLASLSRRRTVEAASDLIVSPTYVPDLVHATLDLVIDGEIGIWHLANEGAISWCGFAQELAAAAGFDPTLVIDRPASHFRWPAPRPAQSALDSKRGRLLPPLSDALRRYIQDRSMSESAFSLEDVAAA